MKDGKDRCPGCDCRNITGSVTGISAKKRSCCGKCGSPNTVCSYVVEFECEHAWPLITDGIPTNPFDPACSNVPGFYWPGFPYGDPGKWISNKTADGYTGGLSPVMCSPFVFLGKTCNHYDGVGLNSSDCIYASYVAPGPSDLVHACNIYPSYWRDTGAEVPDNLEWTGGFPWKNPIGPGYIPFAFEEPYPQLVEWFDSEPRQGLGRCTWYPWATPEWVLANNEVARSFYPRPCPGYCECDARYTTIVYGPRMGWKLDLDGGPTLSFMAESSDMWAIIGKSPPTYEFSDDGEWSCDRKNSMRLVNFQEWPSLKRNICVAPSKFPVFRNPCTDRDVACKCCESGNMDSVVFDINIRGCKINHFNITDRRYYSLVDLIDALGSRFSDFPFPSPTPCGAFVGFEHFDICSSIVGGVTHYWAGLAFVFWCDGTEYQFKLYCEEVDNFGYHVGWSEVSLTIDSRSCDCLRPTITFTITNMPCCCPPPCCNCATLPASAALFGSSGSLSGTKRPCPQVSWVFPAGTINGLGVNPSRVECSGGVWTWDVADVFGVHYTIPLAWDGDCSAILLTGTFNGGPVTVIA